MVVQILHKNRNKISKNYHISKGQNGDKIYAIILTKLLDNKERSWGSGGILNLDRRRRREIKRTDRELKSGRKLWKKNNCGLLSTPLGDLH